MAKAMKSITLSIFVDCDPKKVCDFVSNPPNLAKWATTFCRGIKKVKGEWEIETPQGRMKVRFADANHFGILDHFVCPAPGVEVYVPMRVVPNGSGSEVLFTLFQQPGMSEEAYANDQELVKKDLANLKVVMEKNKS